MYVSVLLLSSCIYGGDESKRNPLAQQPDNLASQRMVTVRLPQTIPHIPIGPDRPVDLRLNVTAETAETLQKIRAHVELSHSLHVTPEATRAFEVVTERCPPEKCPLAVVFLCTDSLCLRLSLLPLLLLPYKVLKEGPLLALNFAKDQLERCRRKRQ